MMIVWFRITLPLPWNHRRCQRLQLVIGNDGRSLRVAQGSVVYWPRRLPAGGVADGVRSSLLLDSDRTVTHNIAETRLVMNRVRGDTWSSLGS